MKKTSQEIMNGIEKIERLLMDLSDDDCQVDVLCVNLGRLKAQRQERLECYKKFLKYINEHEQVFIEELEQEIKILEGK